MWGVEGSTYNKLVEYQNCTEVVIQLEPTRLQFFVHNWDFCTDGYSHSSPLIGPFCLWISSSNNAQLHSNCSCKLQVA